VLENGAEQNVDERPAENMDIKEDRREDDAAEDGDDAHDGSYVDYGSDDDDDGSDGDEQEGDDEREKLDKDADDQVGEAVEVAAATSRPSSTQPQPTSSAEDPPSSSPLSSPPPPDPPIQNGVHHDKEEGSSSPKQPLSSTTNGHPTSTSPINDVLAPSRNSQSPSNLKLPSEGNAKISALLELNAELLKCVSLFPFRRPFLIFARFCRVYLEFQTANLTTRSEFQE
jgi:hypothetical protein